MNHISISKETYITIKALFLVASQDMSRKVLSHVFYDHAKEVLLATDGYIFRVEKMTLWESDEVKVSENLYFSKIDFTLTTKNTKENNIVPCQVESAVEEKYPNVWAVVPKVEKISDLVPLGFVSISPEYYSRFDKSVPFGSKIYVMCFTGQSKAILVYRNDFEEPFKEFLGIIMPLRVGEDRYKISDDLELGKI